MGAPISANAMCQLLVKARLMSANEAGSLWERWRAVADDLDDADGFRRFLIDEQVLTVYQAALVLVGRQDGYFVGPYRILDRLGRGRMAGVYRASAADGRELALKILPPSKAGNLKLLARFQREMRLMLELDHPNVVKCFDSGEVNGLNYIAMECLAGETLAEVLQRRGRLGISEACRVIHRALLGLHHLHEKGIIHRDLKPANLMIVPPPTNGAGDSTLHSEVKLLDIGLGRRVLPEANSAEEQETQLTTEGVLLGTPDYWAPEQARDSHAVDIRADIYSLGCVLYHCLTGQPPFPDTEMMTQIIRHVTEPLRPASELNPDVPDGLQQVLNFMMAKEPSQRYPTPERAARALQLFLPADAPSAPEEVAMSEKKPNPKPAPGGPEIPVGRLVGKAEKPAAPPAAKAKPKPAEPAAVAVAAAMPAAPAGDYDVELVAVPCPPPVMPRKPREERHLFDLDRRDFIMMGAGIGGTLAAVIMGLGVAKLLQGKSEEKPE